MINSYSDIKDDVEHLYNNKSANDFISICSAALGGKRGLDRSQLIRAVASDSVDRVHNLLEPLVEELIAEKKELAKQDDEYNIVPLGNNEFRLIKIKNRDKYGRGASDYIVNTVENTCTCPEFTNRLRNLFLPCKHQYMLDVSVTANSIVRLIKLANNLDEKRFYNEANEIDTILFSSDFHL